LKREDLKRLNRNCFSEEDVEAMRIFVQTINRLIDIKDFNEESFKDMKAILDELGLMRERHIIAYMALLKQGYTPDD